MDKKILRIREVAKDNGYCMKYRHISKNNMYVFQFFATDFLDGFAFSVNVNDNEDEGIFINNISEAIYKVLRYFSVEKETEKYLAKVGCKSRFSEQANKIYMEINYYIYNIYSMFFNLAK